MQHLVLAALVALPAVARAQQAAGTQLWRIAAGTLPLPPALATGASAWWNPAQPNARSAFSLELIQTPATIGASGFLAGIRVAVPRVGRLGVAYGRMGMDDLVRTTLSPAPDGAPVSYYTHAGRVHWAGDLGRTTVGAAVAYHTTTLDTWSHDRWTLDVGVRHPFGDRITIAAATHFFSRLGSDPAQDVYGGVQIRLWQGELWSGGGRANVHARYGLAVGNGYAADHQVGTGIDVGGAFAADLLVVREGGYGIPSWRPVAGIQIRVGRYRIVFAGDAGPRSLGAAYRVGLEARSR
jgi:hypothetical protein